MSMRQLTSRSTIGSASSVPSQDILVSRSHAADKRSLRANDEPCSRDRRQRLVGIVVAVVAICAAILVAAAIVRMGRMKSDGAASPLGTGRCPPCVNSSDPSERQGFGCRERSAAAQMGAACCSTGFI